ncbi:hypothetical protein C4577_02480 [Candidatus Parcubacteria bacterium]|nr:MAG: hypothetical protein C4577_02480 [Candidatus Parcubacteria bacterium]
MKNTNKINILIAGGAGFWSELNHYPAILQLKKEGVPVNIVAICDINDPYKEKDRLNLKQILNIDKPIWVKPVGTTFIELEKELNRLISRVKIDVIIISTNPVYHYLYSKWALIHKINILCDKPLVITKNASFNLENAIQMQKQFDELEELYIKIKIRQKNYMFCTPLRRRALTPFIKIAQEIQKVYDKTGENIRYMNLVVNSGLHRYPIEFLKGGAHGYLDGVGSLAHSSYHFIDIIAWYLSLAKGDIAKIKVELPYVFRVNDYLKIKGYKKIKDLIEGQNSNIYENAELSKSVLNSELDFDFHLHLLDKNNNKIGLISYSCHHTSYSPRLVKYDPNVIDHAHDRNGGRMSQLYIDIQQGALQNWQLIKNDIVFYGNNIEIIGRKHPRIGQVYKKEIYEEAYEKGTISPKDLLKSFIKFSAGLRIPKKHMDLLATIENQRLTNKLFTKCYEKIAEEYERKNETKERIKISSAIELKEYL